MLSSQLSSETLSFFLLATSLLGLLVGSFLNVVIIRLPRMLYSAPTSFNLCFPGSHCPNCQHAISWFDNIPIFSFLWLRGQCRHCHQKISLRYPLIELSTALLSLLVALKFGLTPMTLAGLVLTWILIAVTFIDMDHKLIPDNLTLPGLWIGLLINIPETFQTASSAILGATFGYLVLWATYWIFKAITGKEGMGYGDFKLLAMLGAWLGWQALSLIVLISSFLGALIGIALILFQKRDKNLSIPFGPFLSIGGFIALLWGPALNNFYFKFFSL